MDNETASILRAAHLRRFAPKLLACILLLLMFSVVFATPAHAGVLEDLGEILKDPGAWLVDKFLRDPAESLLNAYANTMSAFPPQLSDYLARDAKGDADGLDLDMEAHDMRGVADVLASRQVESPGLDGRDR